jgi:hypothetical protein
MNHRLLRALGLLSIVMAFNASAYDVPTHYDLSIRSARNSVLGQTSKLTDLWVSGSLDHYKGPASIVFAEPFTLKII